MRAWCFLLLAGCAADSSDLRPLEAALSAAVSLGATSSLAMSAVDSAAATTVCAQVTAPCAANYPCNGAVTISLGAGCPLPLGSAASGTVDVSGSWQSADSATLSSTFTGVQAAVVVGSKSVSVEQSGSGVSLRYLWQNVDVAAGAGTLDAQSSWTVDVDEAAPADDPSDDSYTISGSDQGVSSQVSQLNASGVIVQPSCRLNPVGGSATIQKVSTLSIVQSTVSFHAACDGRADVTDSGSSHSVTLDFLQ